METIGEDMEAPPSWERLFGARVKGLRQERAWTQEDLAERLTAAGHPMHQTTVAKMESGSRPTNVGEIAVLASTFDVPIAALFDASDDVDVHLELRALNSVIRALRQKEDRVRKELEALRAERMEAENTLRSLRDGLRRVGYRRKSSSAPHEHVNSQPGGDE